MIHIIIQVLALAWLSVMITFYDDRFQIIKHKLKIDTISNSNWLMSYITTVVNCTKCLSFQLSLVAFTLLGYNLTDGVIWACVTSFISITIENLIYKFKK